MLTVTLFTPVCMVDGVFPQPGVADRESVGRVETRRVSGVENFMVRFLSLMVERLLLTV